MNKTKPKKVSPIGDISDKGVKLAQCEEVIRRHEMGAFETGRALAAINAGQLYKIAGLKSFSDYCKTKWAMSDKYAYRLIDAAHCLAVLGQHQTKDNWVLPRNEAQIRPLIRHGENKWVSAWQKVMKKFAGKSFTAEDIDDLLNPSDSKTAVAKSKPTKEVEGKLVKVASLVKVALNALKAKKTITTSEVRKLLVDIQNLIDAKK